MKAKDRIKYASILSKIAKQKLSELTDEEYEWLTSNRDLIVGIKKQKEKYDILKHCTGIHDTIEEILFVLDLSDRMYR